MTCSDMGREAEVLAIIHQRYMTALSHVSFTGVNYERWLTPDNWACVFDTGGEAMLLRPIRNALWGRLGEDGEIFCAQPGDIVLVLDTSTAMLASDRAMLHETPRNAVDPTLMAVQPGYAGDVDLIIGRARRDVSFVTSAAPPIVHVPVSSRTDFPCLFAIADVLSISPAHGDPIASEAILRRLTEALAIEIASYMLTIVTKPHSWMAGFADRHVAEALALLHSDTCTTWTVGLLASRVGVSRSVFAQRFHELVGVPPNRYLRQIRLQQAALLMQTDQRSLGQISLMVGYLSEAAFNKAFVREYGVTPGRYRFQNTGLGERQLVDQA